MNLRPHHLLCIQKFTRNGYDQAFTKHMTGIVSRLVVEPETEITLTYGCDFVCVLCPNKKNEACLSAEKVQRMDDAVLKICGLTYGENVSWAELSRRARERILRSERFDRVCDSCEWYALCKNTETPQ